LDAFQTLAYKYARAIDQRDLDGVCDIFTDDGRISGPGFDMSGRSGFEGMIKQVSDNFLKTQHQVFNVLAEIDGDTATGETYCQANHIIKNEDGSWLNHAWAIRYQDSYVKDGANWKYKARKLIVDWTTNTPAGPLNLGERT